MHDPSDKPEPVMLPMAEIPWSEWADDREEAAPPPPVPWTRAWCREQQTRALKLGNAFYEARYDSDGSTPPVLVVGVGPTCPGCGATLPLAETTHAIALTAFVTAQHTPTGSFRFTSGCYSSVCSCSCGVSSWWELRWQNYGSAWDLRSRHPALTIAVAVSSAERHRPRPGDTDIPIL
jgi:hypothetical protein